MLGTYPEDSLHLCQVWPWMFSRQHLYDETPYAPDVGLFRIRRLFDDLGRHPEDGTLERGSVETHIGQQVCE
jgi:hypothetical protein